MNDYDKYILSLKEQQAMTPYEGKAFEEPPSRVLYVHEEVRPVKNIGLHLHIHQGESQPTYLQPYDEGYYGGEGIPAMVLLIAIGSFIFLFAMLIGLLAR